MDSTVPHPATTQIRPGMDGLRGAPSGAGVFVPRKINGSSYTGPLP
ncbi:MAG TPA: hypothetical protein VGH10_00170 [Actinomycetota bacterium]